MRLESGAPHVPIEEAWHTHREHLRLVGPRNRPQYRVIVVGNADAALKEDLAQKHLISGSAVVPNLETDEQWSQKAQELAATVQEKLRQEKEKLVGK